jgi:DNA-binding CsgD family transcriptional regulator
VLGRIDVLRRPTPLNSSTLSPFSECGPAPDQGGSNEHHIRFSESPEALELDAFGELIHAIGTSQFEILLFETARKFVDVDHYSVVTFASDETPRYVASHGVISAQAFAEVSRCYEAELFRLDPNFPKIMASRSEAKPVALEYGDGAAYLPFYRRKVLDPVAISDKHAFAFWRERTGYYISFYLTHGRKFSEEAKRRLDRINAPLAAPIARHFSFLPRIPQGASNFLERVLSASPLFQTTTTRERAVCLGILRGHTSESISLHLNISRNTVLTYRKRLYEKLGICSQHELFMLFIRSAQKFDRPSSAGSADPFVVDSCIEWVDGFA